jgi:hypothetical protein
MEGHSRNWIGRLKEVFENYGLNTSVITRESDSDVRFEIFERLNTGSVSLTIRNSEIVSSEVAIMIQ